MYTLFRNMKFMLDEMFQRNASKFAILFFVFHFVLLYFPLMNALDYVDIDHIPKVWQILKRFNGTFHQA